MSKELLIRYSNSLSKNWLDESTHKIYPFYTHQCLSIDPENPFNLICDNCGYSDEGNRVVKSANFVFFDKETVKIYCCRTCMPEECISYENQIYGFATPVRFPEHLKGSMLHVIVWDQLYESTKYKLQKYVNKRFTVEQLKSDRHFNWCFFPEHHGSHCSKTSWINRHGYISVTEFEGQKATQKKTTPILVPDDARYVPTDKKKIKSLLEISPGMIADAMTDIMTSVNQLTLF